MGSAHMLSDKLHGTLTVAAILLDGVGGQLDRVLAGVLLGEHQLLHLTLCVQDSHLQDCGDRGRKGMLSVSIPRQGSCYAMRPAAKSQAQESGPGVTEVLTHILLGSQEASGFPDIVGQQEGPLLQDI